MVWHPVALAYLALVCMLAAAFVTAVHERHRFPGPVTLLVLVAGAGGWNAAMAGGILAADPALSQAMGQIATYPAMAVTLLGTSYLVLATSDPLRKLSRRAALMLSVEPAIMTVLAVTNPWHHLVADPAEPGDSALVATGNEGPAVTANTLYSAVLIVGLLLTVGRRGRRSSISRSHQLAPVAGGLTLVVLVSLLRVWRMLEGVDPTPVLAGVVVLAVAWTLLRSGFFDLVPTSRAAVLDYVNDAVFVFSAADELVEFNASAQRLLQLGTDGAVAPRLGMSLSELGSLAPPPDENGITTVASNGATRWLELKLSVLTNRRGDTTGRALVVHDVTDLFHKQLRLEETNDRLSAQLAENEVLHTRLRYQATHDDLTGLPNRRRLGALLDEAMDTVRASGTSMALFMIDVDHFKRINDQFGHAAGDAVLRDVAAAIRSHIRAEDTVARYGGEEFTVLLPGLTGRGAVDRAERILDGVRAVSTVPAAGRQLTVTVSIGVVVVDQDDARRHSVDTLLTRADRALYHAKRRGRNRVEIYDEPFTEPTARGA